MDIEKCRCYYKILNVQNNATLEEIKKSYKKIILQYHPDKNAHLPEEEQRRCTNIFRCVQEAYECLIDEKRRKWYDKNRWRIIRGKGDEEEADEAACGPNGQWERSTKDVNRYYSGSRTKINIWEYFSNNCYNGFDDKEENNFYNVYKKLFENIIKEENEELTWSYNNRHKEDKEEKINAPSFGNSKTSGKDIDDFYDYWTNFSTVKKFDYYYEYLKNAEFENRNVRRNLKKAGEKRSIKERKEYNDNIRSLVQHLKKHDIRYLNRVVEIAEEKRKKIEEIERHKKQQMMLKRKLLFEQNNFKREYLEHKENDNSSARWSSSNEDNFENKGQSTYNGCTYGEELRRKNPDQKKEEKVKKGANPNEGDVKAAVSSIEAKTTNAANATNAVCTASEHKKRMHTGDDNDDDEEDTIVYNKIIYRCDVCRKNFKSMKQYTSHESSKKHLTNFLKNAQKYELNGIFREDEGGETGKEVHKEVQQKDWKEVQNDVCEDVEQEVGQENSSEIRDEEKSKAEGSVKKEKKKKKMKMKKKKEEMEKENTPYCRNTQKDTNSAEKSSNSNEDLLSWYKNGKKKNKDIFLQAEKSVFENKDSLHEDLKVSNSSSDYYETSRRKKKKPKKKKKKEGMNTINKEVNNPSKINKDGTNKQKVNGQTECKLKESINKNQCKVCNETFNSRNKLFEHIQTEGHAAYKDMTIPTKMSKNRRER
ncbi:DnaJ protein, putative [Plasmodium malariae]|uniref:DnaJ protein, putative n=1 Tax=Plasmodium malariae TaxID=5858 RepID=A0A1A8VY22_PLAMA|nr:DnaJ protein, putative [Plasmodium malariae]SBS84264.1 DnaJ protein, putative [Plasmodium malariae]SCN12089.1 DnaJ protein, putative [Plasmodium malariae]